MTEEGSARESGPAGGRHTRRASDAGRSDGQPQAGGAQTPAPGATPPDASAQTPEASTPATAARPTAPTGPPAGPPDNHDGPDDGPPDDGPPEDSKADPEREVNDPRVIVLATAVLLAFGISLIASLVNLWPTVESITASTTTTTTTAAAAANATQRHTVHILFAIVTVKVTPGTALLLVVVMAGALGSVIHTATSFSDFVGNRRLFTSWIAWYVLRPLIGASLAVLIYFAVRGGFLNGNGQSSNINPYGIAALGGLAGLFSKQATDKLREVFETLFRVSDKVGDAQRKDDLANPAPVIRSIDPKSVRAGAKGVTLAIGGEHFVAQTVGCIDKAEQTTTYVSPQLIKVDVPDQLLAQAGKLEVTAQTAGPGGGTSEPLGLVVTP